MRLFAVLSLVLASALACGCLAPCRFCDGCSGCEVANCNDCDGAPPPIPCTPWEHLCQARRSVVCGGGCGEVYYDEWFSNPPDCVDPCDGCNNWVGGDGCKCLPLSRFDGIFAGLWGQRFRCDDTPDVLSCMVAGWCDICESDPCCCDGGSHGGEVYNETYAPEFDDFGADISSVEPPRMVTGRQARAKSNPAPQSQPTVATPPISIRR
jgi:hypothetical protein